MQRPAMQRPAVVLPWVAQNHPAPMPKAEWGPIGWAWLHTEAINYPAAPSHRDRVEAYRRFWSFIKTLPCFECRTHSIEYIRAHPPNFVGTESYQDWAWRFHNAVNYRLKKPLMSREEYYATYRPDSGGAESHYERYRALL